GEAEVRLRRNRNEPLFVPLEGVVDTVLRWRQQLYAELMPAETA
ncbi:MAG: hypothetical protein RJAPGHWK_001099, partial [Candidatus Fervidibacter sp.]